MTSALPFSIEPMRLEDIAEVSKVERRCFQQPMAGLRLSARAAPPRSQPLHRAARFRCNSVQSRERFVDEFAENWRGLRALGMLSFHRRPQAPPTAPQPISGFAGMWQLYDEAHVTTIGVDAPFRGRGLGEALLLRLLDESVRRGANMLTLEVRISNEGAIRLYEKFGFSIHGVRPRYYSDNGEDAYLMWSPSLRDDAYLAQVDVLRHALVKRLAGVLAVPESTPIWASRRLDDRNVS